MSQINSNQKMIKNEKLIAARQVDRLRKEDDEEQWISGEELNTDGSSDEDSSINRAERKSNYGSKQKTPSHGAIKKGKLRRRMPLIAVVPDPAFSAELCSSRNDMKSAETALLYKDGESCSNSLEIIDDQLEEISWRPKRGSIKLPNLNAEELIEGDIKSYVMSSEEIKAQFSKIKTALLRVQPYPLTSPPNEENATQIPGSLKTDFNETNGMIGDALKYTKYSEALLQNRTKKGMEAPGAAIVAKMDTISPTYTTIATEPSDHKKKAGTHETLGKGNSKTEEHGNTIQCSNGKHTNGDWNEYDILKSDSFETKANHGTETPTGVIVNSQVQPKRKLRTLRNIELVTDGYGKGMLAITKAEKIILDGLLKNIDQADDNDEQIMPIRASNEESSQHCGYSMSQESIDMVNNIECKLQMFGAQHKTSSSATKPTLIEAKSASSFNVNKRLAEINQSLASLKAVADK